MDWKVVLSLFTFVLGDILGLDLKFLQLSAYVKISQVNVLDVLKFRKNSEILSDSALYIESVNKFIFIIQKQGKKKNFLMKIF